MIDSNTHKFNYTYISRKINLNLKSFSFYSPERKNNNENY